MAPPRRRETLISLDMEEILLSVQREREQAAAAQQQQQQQQRQVGQTQQQPSRSRAPEALVRCMAFTRFCWSCSIGGCYSLAPPGLAAMEASTMFLVYLLAVPNALLTRQPLSQYTYSFPNRAEDVMVLSLARCLTVTAAHLAGIGPLRQRPYLWTAGAFLLGVPLALMKAVALHHSAWPRRKWPPFLALYVLLAVFSVAHLLAAQRMVVWARRRWEAGLGGFGWPLAEGEEAWLLAGQMEAQQLQQQTMERGEAGPAEGDAGGSVQMGEDMAPEALADPDSRFLEVQGCKLHWKAAVPVGGLPSGTVGSNQNAGQSLLGEAAIVLVHSFGGGTFSWRHVMQPLADACGMPVVAIDRPGFGLSCRPTLAKSEREEGNPYMLKQQAVLLLQACSLLGLRRVLLAGHADGALLALMAAAAACREQQPPSSAPAVGVSVPAARLTPAMTVTSGHDAGSVANTLDWAWMGSVDKDSVLQRLLTGDWPSSLSSLHKSPLKQPLLSHMHSNAADPSPPAEQLTSQDLLPFKPLNGRLAAQGPAAAGATSPLRPPQPLQLSFVQEAAALDGPGNSTPVEQQPRGLAVYDSLSSLSAKLSQQQVQQPSAAPAPKSTAAAGLQTEQAQQDQHTEAGWETPAVAGLALLHPDLTGQVAPRYTRVLANSRLGRGILRGLLRTEIGEAGNPRAWASSSLITPELLEIYRRPLHVQGWDMALTEVCRTQNDLHSLERSHLLGTIAAYRLPTLVATGERDHISSPAAAARLVERLASAGPRLAVLPAVGHMSFEESPSVLRGFLSSFARDVLPRLPASAAPTQAQCPAGASRRLPA